MDKLSVSDYEELDRVTRCSRRGIQSETFFFVITGLPFKKGLRHPVTDCQLKPGGASDCIGDPKTPFFDKIDRFYSKVVIYGPKPVICPPGGGVPPPGGSYDRFGTINDHF